MRDSQPSLLLVDDDPANLEILTDHLEEAGYHTVTASDGEEAWERLQTASMPFHAVLLDRMMPNMGGMEVLARVKSCESFATLPIIMQTAAASPEEIRQGIQAGAFYYLAKPFAKEVLLAIVQAAVRDFDNNTSLQDELKEQSRVFKGLESATFHFQTLEEAKTLALLLAQACPEPERAAMGLMDLLVNAVEHGNLRMSYDEKTALQQSGMWEAEVARRLALPELADKKAMVRFSKQADSIEMYIKDQGTGFDWKQYLEISPDLAFSSHGRGIAMAKALSFDTLEYLGAGNEVRCTITR